MSGMDEMSDGDFTRSVVTVLRGQLPSTSGASLFDALDGIKFRRDKKVAHQEIVDDDEMPNVTWGWFGR